MISLPAAWQKIGYDCHLHLREHVHPFQEPPAHLLKPLLDAARDRHLIPLIREHLPLPRRLCIGPQADYLYAMRESEIAAFLDQFTGTGVPVGLEVDYVAGFEAETVRIIARLQTEIQSRGLKISGLAGSVHLLPGEFVEFDGKPAGLGVFMLDYSVDVFQQYYQARGPEQVLADYFNAIESLIKTGWFQVISHLDIIRKFEPFSAPPLFFKDYEDLYLAHCRRIVACAQAQQMALELNTAGMNQPWGRPYLHQAVLNYCAESGVGVQVGSDAHKPQAIGQYFDVAYEMLLQAGIEEIVIFENQQPVKKSII